MRAGDAADAIMELPQERRQVVLDLLPDGQRTKFRTLLGYNTLTAGGLMASISSPRRKTPPSVTH